MPFPFQRGANRFNNKEFETTVTELEAIAAAAKIGCIKMPKGARMPAAMGMKAVL